MEQMMLFLIVQVTNLHIFLMYPIDSLNGNVTVCLFLLLYVKHKNNE